MNKQHILSPRKIAWQRFCKHRAAFISAIILGLMCLMVIFGEVITNHLGISATKTNLLQRFTPASVAHPFGTDALGRDLFARLLSGGAISLKIAFIVAFSTAIIGGFIGITAGYFRGWVDAILMRITDIIIALPLLPLLVILAAIDLQKVPFASTIADHAEGDIYRIIIIISCFAWTGVARLTRARTLEIRNQTYIQAAKAMGVSPFKIIWRHVLPNAASPLIVATTLSIGNIILLESVLSFLGLGIQPPTASWGNLLNNAQDLIWDHPMLTFYPGFLIFVTVICFNFLGDGLQDALNHKKIQKQ